MSKIYWCEYCNTYHAEEQKEGYIIPTTDQIVWGCPQIIQDLRDIYSALYDKGHKSIN